MVVYEGPPITAKGSVGWISVEDWLPENDTPVLAKLAYESEPVVAYLCKHGWLPSLTNLCIDHGYPSYGDGTIELDDDGVTHWMPLPAPPK